MIDTVVMVLEHGKFTIKDPNRFSPPADLAKDRIRLNKAERYKFVCNATKQEKETHYYPKLTLQQQCFGNGGFIVKLKIEFSAPKLVFGDNFNELKDGDFELVLETLLKRLDEMAICVKADHLKKAYIQKIDYSKNIALDQYVSCSMVIGEIAKLNLNQRLDLTKTNYRNDGQALAFHSGLFELKIYDKIKDIEQGKKFGKKRAMETESEFQPDLFNYTNYKNRLGTQNLQVLRLEGRFQRKKLTSLFKKLKIDSELSFEALFNSQKSKAILMHYLSEITDQLRVMQFSLDKTDELIASIKSKNPTIKPAKLLQLIGFIQTVQSIGNRGARVELNLPKHQWYRLQNELKMIESNKKNHRFLSVLDLQSKLQNFEPLRLQLK